jgi:malonyl CoA-acyl carrier protein transacylase
MTDNAPTALLFPGQGSQTDDMREIVARTSPELLEHAVKLIGVDPFERVEDGTAYAQPALYCAGLARWTAAGRPEASFMAGHSLGELPALAAAGSIGEIEGLTLAVARGRAMQEAGESGSPGGMMAVLGKGEGEGAAQTAERLGLTIANDNAPGQVVLSGPLDALETARTELKDAGLKAMSLPVGGAFHSPAMAAAAPAFEAALAEVEITPPRVTVVSSITTQPFDDIRRELALALTSPVRWRETLIAMSDAGARRFVETGPGNVLTKLVRRTVDGAEASVLEVPEATHA